MILMSWLRHWHCHWYQTSSSSSIALQAEVILGFLHYMPTDLPTIGSNPPDLNAHSSEVFLYVLYPYSPTPFPVLTMLPERIWLATLSIVILPTRPSQLILLASIKRTILRNSAECYLFLYIVGFATPVFRNWTTYFSNYLSFKNFQDTWIRNRQYPHLSSVRENWSYKSLQNFYLYGTGEQLWLHNP